MKLLIAAACLVPLASPARAEAQARPQRFYERAGAAIRDAELCKVSKARVDEAYVAVMGTLMFWKEDRDPQLTSKMAAFLEASNSFGADADRPAPDDCGKSEAGLAALEAELGVGPGSASARDAR